MNYSLDVMKILRAGSDMIRMQPFGLILIIHGMLLKMFIRSLDTDGHNAYKSGALGAATLIMSAVVAKKVRYARDFITASIYGSEFQLYIYIYILLETLRCFF